MTDRPGPAWGASPGWSAPPPPSGGPTWAGRPSSPGGAPPAPVPVPRDRTLPTWLVVLALVVLPPVGVLLVWTSSHWRTRVRAAVTAAVVTIAGLVLLGVAVPAAGVDPGTPAVLVSSSPVPTPLGTPSASPTPAPTPSPSTADASAALVALAALAVRADGGAPGYDRDAFGPAWTDTDRNGCDTRNDVLARDLTDVVVKPGTNGCAVQSGRLLDPWSGQAVPFERGRSTIEIDHVVALADAWRSGAGAWPYARLLAFANDPLELLAVPGALNQAKSDSDASEWLPEQGVCAFAARQVAVKQKYGLSVTSAERDALRGALADCPGEPLPSSALPTIAPNRSPPPKPAAPAATVPAVPAPVEPPPAVPAAPAAPDYGTCAAAKAAGGGPYVAGRDPEYAYYRDPDGDGVTCE